MVPKIYYTGTTQWALCSSDILSRASEKYQKVFSALGWNWLSNLHNGRLEATTTSEVVLSFVIV
jgi:hypothetical protein